NQRSGSTPGWLHVHLDPVGLAPGTYQDSVIVSAGNAAGSPAAVPVEFVVHPCDAAAIALDAQLSDSLTRQSCAAPHRTRSFARPRPPAAPDALAQLTSDGVTAIPVGGSVDQPSVVLRGTVSDPDVGDTLRLQVEALPVSTAFTGTPTAVSDRTSSGQRPTVTLTGLADNTSYHWRART